MAERNTGLPFPGHSPTLEAELAAARGELQAARERLRQLLDSATGHAIVTLDIALRVTSWTRGAGRLLGWQAGEVIGLPYETFFMPEERAAGLPAREAALAMAEGQAAVEGWRRRADGGRVWASGWMTVLRGAGMQPAGLLLILSDRTREQQAAEALRQREEKLRYTVELSPQIPWTADPEGGLTDFSPRWTALTGMTLEATRGWGWLEAVHPDDRARIGGKWRHSLATGEAFDGEARMRVRDRFRWFRSRANPRRDAAGRILLWYGTSEDIHDRKASEARLEALVELGDRLRELREPGEISHAAAEVIGRTLGASRAGFAITDPAEASWVERDWTDGSVESIAGQWNLREFWDNYADSIGPLEGTSVADTATDPRTLKSYPAHQALSIRAFIWAPVVDGGRIVSFLFVHNATPRAWSDDEVSFARGAAERAWAAMERASAEVRQSLMTLELNHRVKNTLSVVQSMALQTARGSASLSTFGSAFQARLTALARAHDLLTRAEWRGAALRDVVEAAVASGSGIRLDLSGCAESEVLSPAQALSLTMALHELATNAAKYGALSVPGGHVSITCRTEQEGDARRVEWREQGGPPLEGPPPRKGFGMRLLERGLSTRSGLVATLDFTRQGLRCSMLLPRLPSPAPPTEAAPGALSSGSA
ncbi:PAS domain-containing sensor histidine kinase [Pseudoroseomonas ludipueritiae]|uniref:histidine kinase n=1 Tax=Pseudoroseomonas ludipueritiae TaxID=198093 RepID=A0ABR7R962_9PROT|nr:PAS domain S-box protein [Pseudoroseomonas ludipueritiae]MBC9178097.1 PAS domain S-box protein [Pseudoroseomonas ludipueritiae]